MFSLVDLPPSRPPAPITAFWQAENPAFLNASVEFNPVTLRATYRVLWGTAGASHALDVAANRGVPAHIIERAAALLEPNSHVRSNTVVGSRQGEEVSSVSCNDTAVVTGTRGSALLDCTGEEGGGVMIKEEAEVGRGGLIAAEDGVRISGVGGDGMGEAMVASLMRQRRANEEAAADMVQIKREAEQLVEEVRASSDVHCTACPGVPDACGHSFVAGSLHAA